MEPLKVSSKSAPNAVAGAIAGVIRESGSAELQAVGAGAANQAIKAVAIARGYLAPAGIDLVCIPAFASVVIDGEERTAIRLIVNKDDEKKGSRRGITCPRRLAGFPCGTLFCGFYPLVRLSSLFYGNNID